MAYISQRKLRVIEQVARGIKNLRGPHSFSLDKVSVETRREIEIWKESWVACPAAQIAAAIGNTVVSCPTCGTHKASDLERNYS